MTADKLMDTASQIRRDIFKIAYHANGGHMGAAFSVTDILVALYFGDILKYDVKEPDWIKRDRFILSKGHASYALYAVLAHAGYFDKEVLKHVGKPGSSFGGHPKMDDIPGVEASTGALGHGLALAIGMAYAYKQDKIDSHIYVVLGDGECQEGSVWEGALSAPTLALDNLTVIVDHNKLQAMDKLESIVKMQPFAEKWKTFGWNVIEVDGHNFDELQKALKSRQPHQPTLVVAHTTKGKGVSFMENVPIWHYRMPNENELTILMNELGLTKEALEE